jgi:carboxypeptidase Taq
VDADEVTYPLHIILRYEIEKKLFSGEITVDDIPEYWNSAMLQNFNINTKNDYKNGPMQDVHWPSGAFGYFPSYTLGRMIAAQLFATFIKNHGDFPSLVTQGKFQVLKQWLNTNVHAYGSLLGAEDLLKKVTGQALDPQFFIEHIKNVNNVNRSLNV